MSRLGYIYCENILRSIYVNSCLESIVANEANHETTVCIYMCILYWLYQYRYYYLNFFAQHQLNELGKICPQLSNNLNDFPHILSMMTIATLQLVSADSQLESITVLQQQSLLVQDAFWDLTQSCRYR